MIDPYRMVVVNITASLFLGTGIFFYRFIFPKKKLNFFLLIILISLLPLISLLRNGDYESGDFNIHLYRAISFYESLKDGNLIPSWAGKLNGTYGYPLFIFNYTLPYYIVSLFHFLGFSFIVSMKLFLAVAHIASGIFMYLWSEKIFKKRLAVFTAPVFYLFSPYHLVDLHFRVSVGEITAFAILPLFLYCFHIYINKKNILYFLLVGLTFYLLFLAHPGTTFFSFYILVPYLLYLLKKEDSLTLKNFFYGVFPLAIGFLLSIYVWLPYVSMIQYTHADELTSQSIIFPKVWELFFSPWRLGFLFQGPKGELAFLIGYTQLLIVFYILYKHIVQKKHKFLLDESLWLFIFFFLFLLLTPASKQLWRLLPFLNIGQFAYRLLLPLSICTSILSGYFAEEHFKKKTLIVLLIVTTIAYTGLNWGHRRVIPEITEQALINNLPLSTSQGEALCCIGNPRWADNYHPWMDKVPKMPIEILKGQGQVKILQRTTQYHEYISSSDTNLFIKENTYYFPGWKLLIDKNLAPISYQTKEYPGIITFNLSKGLHSIEVWYDDIWFFKLTKLVSLTFISVCIIYIGIYFGKLLLRRR